MHERARATHLIEILDGYTGDGLHDVERDVGGDLAGTENDSLDVLNHMADHRRVEFSRILLAADANVWPSGTADADRLAVEHGAQYGLWDVQDREERKMIERLCKWAM